MKLRHLMLLALAMGISSAALAASPFDGTWVLNQSKSHDAGPDMLTFTTNEQSDTFKTDGTTKRGYHTTFCRGDIL